jgi:RHS repeat-associated protein
MQGTYGYDAVGQRIQKDVMTGGVTTTTRFAYDQKQIWADTDGSNALQVRYQLGDMILERLARVSGGGTAAWLLADRMGSIRNVVDATGAMIATNAFDGFGNLTSQSGVGNAGAYMFDGYRLDSETGLLRPDLSLREYGQAIGRWYRIDPILFKAKQFNPWVYVANNPANSSDPTGLQGKPRLIHDNVDPDWRAEFCKRQLHLDMRDLRREFCEIRRANLNDITLVIIAGHKPDDYWEPGAKATYPRSAIWADVTSTDQLITILRTYHDHSIARLVIGGHGSGTGIRLGAPPEVGITAGGAQDVSAFTIERLLHDPALYKVLRDKLRLPGAKLCASLELQGCSTGVYQPHLDTLSAILRCNVWGTSELCGPWDDKKITWKVSYLTGHFGLLDIIAASIDTTSRRPPRRQSELDRVLPPESLRPSSQYPE